MVKVTTPPPNPKSHEPGVKIMRSMIDARCNAEGVSPRELFKSVKVEQDLIRIRGGQPRELMLLVREAMVASKIPIDAQGLARVRKEGQREFARMLRAEHWPILQKVKTAGNYTRTVDTG